MTTCTRDQRSFILPAFYSLIAGALSLTIMKETAGEENTWLRRHWIASKNQLVNSMVARGMISLHHPPPPCIAGMEESGEQDTLVFAFFVTELATEFWMFVCAGGMLYRPPPPTSRFRNNLCTDDSELFSRFLHDSRLLVTYLMTT